MYASPFHWHFFLNKSEQWDDLFVSLCSEVEHDPLLTLQIPVNTPACTIWPWNPTLHCALSEVAMRQEDFQKAEFPHGVPLQKKLTSHVSVESPDKVNAMARALKF